MGLHFKTIKYQLIYKINDGDMHILSIHDFF